MAKLLSEDRDISSALEIIAGHCDSQLLNTQQQCWQKVILVMHSGQHTISIGKASDADCWLCRKPVDEMERLISELSELANGKRQTVNFEPSEPSFEIVLARSREKGLTVHAWIDSGNAGTGFYRWDALGMRFYTTDEHLLAFIQELQEEFKFSGT